MAISGKPRELARVVTIAHHLFRPGHHGGPALPTDSLPKAWH